VDSIALQIGSAVPRADAYAKVDGSEKYAADYYEEGMLWAGVKRAGVPHGRLILVETTAARQLAGVVAVLTHQDVPGPNRHGIIYKDQPVLVDGVVKHAGDAVALVLAADREILQRALHLIKVDIEPLPGVFDPEEALAPESPLVHPDNPQGNVVLHGTIEIGSASAAFAAGDVEVQGVFAVPYQAPVFLETENGLARLGPEGQLHIIASTQSPFRDRFEVGQALGLDPLKIRVTAPYLGGGFGGKDGVTVQCLLALAAIQAPGRWVKMGWDREESFQAGYKRHPARLYYRLGANTDGVLQALEARLYFDTGAYAHLGGEVVALAMEHAGGVYRIPNAKVEGWCVYTNNPVSGAMRGFGVPQVAFAMEQLMDMLAQQLRQDPLELRQRNAVRRGDTTAVGVTLLNSTGLQECLSLVHRHPIWVERHQWKDRAGAFKRRGVGLAAVMHGSGYGPGIPDYANAKVELTPEGKIRVYSGVADMGQGNISTNLQMAGDLLGQERDNLELVLLDTVKALPSCSASASRTTYTFGKALIKACRGLKKAILQRARLILFLERGDELELLPGRVRHMTSGKELTLPTIARMMDVAERTYTYCHISPIAQERPPGSETLRFHGFPHLVISYGVHVAYVEVDELTGAVTVPTYMAATDAGRVLNPQIYEQQIQGAIVQGLGYALYEEMQVQTGQILTPDLTTYIMPSAMDLPDIISLSVATHEHTGPFGMKGVGEIGINAPLPAIANALADATGGRFFSAPFTPEKILLALAGKEQS
jgi:CO/xanthine dehydrogenase Mo-binding subunit